MKNGSQFYSRLMHQLDQEKVVPKEQMVEQQVLSLVILKERENTSRNYSTRVTQIEQSQESARRPKIQAKVAQVNPQWCKL